MNGTIEHVTRWLDTFSPVSAMTENPDAMALEIETLARVFRNQNADADTIGETFHRIKTTSQSRAWPTAAQVFDALRAVHAEKTGERVVGTQQGNRDALDSHERQKLEHQVIPTARRWLRQFPGLRQHAISTLQYWGEPLEDDMGRKYKAPNSRADA
jgi:hypothetical protein